MTDTTTGNGRRVPDGTVWLFTPRPDAPAELRDALLDWARANGLDPERVIGSDGVEVDLVDQVIRYQEVAVPFAPGAYTGGSGSVWKRRAVAPLLVEPPAVLRRPPIGHTTPAAFTPPAEQARKDAIVEAAETWRWSGETADGHRRAEAALIAAVDAYRTAPVAAYDWARYERTCDPDRQLDGLGDLALFLGGSEDSFTGRLLALIAKAESTPANLAALERGFPREVTAWRVWRAETDRTPTAAELCEVLTGGAHE